MCPPDRPHLRWNSLIRNGSGVLEEETSNPREVEVAPKTVPIYPGKNEVPEARFAFDLNKDRTPTEFGAVL